VKSGQKSSKKARSEKTNYNIISIQKKKLRTSERTKTTTNKTTTKRKLRCNPRN